MIKQKKILEEEHIPEFAASLARLPERRRVAIDRSLAIAHGMMLLQLGIKPDTIKSFATRNLKLRLTKKGLRKQDPGYPFNDATIWPNN